MKPDWKDAPDWANWLAMDADGEWWWYERKPEFFGSYWGVEGYGKRSLSIKTAVDPSRYTRERRPC